VCGGHARAAERIRPHRLREGHHNLPPGDAAVPGASRPVSRVLCPRIPAGRWPSIYDRRCRRPPAANPGTGRASFRPPIWPCSGWGLPSRPVSRPLVRSYRTISPLPRARVSGGPKPAFFDPGAVCFCGTFRRVAPPGCYPAPSPGGARTFLSPESNRGSGHPVCWPISVYRRAPGASTLVWPETAPEHEMYATRLPSAGGPPYNPAGAGFSLLVGPAVFSLAVFCTGIVASREVQQAPSAAMTSSDTPHTAILRLGKGP
jgi:hypothetical protein